MWSLGPLAFAAPWLLLSLAGLPILWWLLRLMPPAPRRIAFPPLRLLLDLIPREETPHRTPWWLLALRLVIAGLLILAAAQPIANPPAQFAAGGPLVILVDNGWSAAPQWLRQRQIMADLIEAAGRENRPVTILATARESADNPIALGDLQDAASAAEVAQRLEPRPWPADRAEALAALETAEFDAAETVWLTDGIAGDPETDRALAERLQRFGALTVYGAAPDGLAVLQHSPENGVDAMIANLERAEGGVERRVTLRAIDAEGRLVGQAEGVFSAGEKTLQVALELPTELRNRIAQLVVVESEAAGSVFLVDERWRRRPVGLMSGGQAGEEETLLGELYYLRRALPDGAELREGKVADLAQEGVAMIALADVGNLTEEEINLLEPWIEAGGVLVRFAGPRMAQNPDSLLPVRLRASERALGGALTWSQPAAMAPFPTEQPFAGLIAPPDIKIYRQVLAEPEIDLGDKIWARLLDGTPLVTGEKRGRGWLVLIHTSANADWSDLALSGVFVQMLDRLLGLSQGVVGEAADLTLPARRTLDGFGRLVEPAINALPTSPEQFELAAVGPGRAPGFYGDEAVQRALNIGAGDFAFAAIDNWPSGVRLEGFTDSQAIDLAPWALAAALALFLLDLLIALYLRGLLPGLRLGTRTAAGAVMLLLLTMAPLSAQEGPSMGDDERAAEATASTHLAYVVTGIAEIDKASEAGLLGLSLVLQQRTAVEAAAPMAIDPARDELAFFPLIYWPVTLGAPALDDATRARLNLYLRNGGMILFDTRDGGSGETLDALATLIEGLDIPALIPSPPDHVLTKAFYLMKEFPGRYATATLYVEAPESDRVNDGVSSVVIGGNDYAAAWAIDNSGRPLYATVPGGQRQREMAYRFGVNLVMYALTGNYKSDQVHVPAILERLGE